MKKLIAALAVLVAIVIATLLTLRSGSPPADTTARPQLDALLVQCDASGSSFATMYDKMAAHMHDYLTLDRHTALAAARGQIANVINGRLATCERAFAVAQHDRRGSAVMVVGPFVERLKLAHDTLDQLIVGLQAGSDTAAMKATLEALEAAVH